MKFNKYLICALFLVLICCIGAASAADSDDVVAADDAIDEDVTEAVDVSDEIDEESLGVSEEPALSDGENNGSDLNEVVIYVGQNKTDGGNGSYDNPFSTFNLACDYANTQNKSQVTLNIYNGTYYLNSHLKFNTSNLVINGIGSPIIKNFYKEENTVMAFGLVSSSSKYIISNVVYDASDKLKDVTKFSLFYGESTCGEFNNCSFVSFNNEASAMIVPGGIYNVKFNNCYFYETQVNTIFSDALSQTTVIEFENCTFNLPNCESLFTGRYEAQVTMTNCWLGKNTFPTFINPPSGYMYNKKGKWITTWKISVNGYAQFSISENYLGNNQYEIVGKLTWDDENNTASMENFQPMNVSLSSQTGEIQSYAILTNGTFKAIYVSNLTEHSVSAVLCSEFKEVTFKSVNVTVDAPSIYYGEDQNITVTLPQAINATANVIINNKTYNLTFNDVDSVTYTIEDRLTEGNYTVDVILSDVENHVYGSNSTVLSVSKVSNYVFDVIPAVEVKVGENATIIITLPSDVSGNVTVKFGNDTQILPANQTMVVKFGNLNATTYPIIVSYSGNDKYTVPDDKIDSISVDPAKSSVNIENIEFVYGETIVIPFAIENATDVKVKVLNGTTEIDNIVENGNIVVNSILDVGVYTVEVTTIVTSNYEETTETATLTINKANSSLIMQDKEFTYATEAIVNVVAINSTGNVIASLIDENNNEIAVTVSENNITLPLLNAGKYTLIVTTNVDNNHNNVTESVTVTIVKAIPTIDVIIEPMENITVNDNVIITVKLPSDATGLILIEVNDIKLFNELNNEGFAIFSLSDLNAKSYGVTAKYLGDNNYNVAVNNTLTFNVSSSISGGVPITVVIDGVEYPVVAVNGTVTIKTKDTVPSNSSKETPVSPAKDATTKKVAKIIASNKKTFKKSKKVKKYTITLKSGKNPIKKVKVTLKIKGKTYKATTNAKGKATFKITKLTKKGKHVAKIKFAGNKNYKASSKSIKIIVK